jgi:hypothetical protein
MPIVYATPEPFAPGISSAYGAAEQFSRDAPAIIGAASHAADIQAQANARADQMRFAYAQANAESQDRRAALYGRSQEMNANREQQALDIGATLTQRNDEALLEANTRMLQQQQGAVLQNWLNGQDLSQKESMRLQQMKAAVADVQASNLPNDQKMDAILKLKTGIDPLEQRLNTSKQRLMKSQADENEAQTAMLAQRTTTMAKVNSMTAPDRIHDALTPEAQAEIDSQNLNPFERDAAIKAAKRAGKFDRFTIEPDGSMKHVPRTKETAAEKPFDVAKAVKNAQHEAELAVPADETSLEGKPKLSAERLQKRNEYATKVFERIRAEHGGLGPVPAAQPGPVNPREETQNVIAQKQIELETRQDLPPAIKVQMLTAMNQAQQMIQEAGGVSKLSAEQKRMIEQMGWAYERLGKPPAPTAAPSPQSQPQPATIQPAPMPTRGLGWANPYGRM